MILGQTPFGTAPLAGGEGAWVREPFGVITITGVVGQSAQEFFVQTGVVAIEGLAGAPVLQIFAPEPGEITISGYAGVTLNGRYDPPLLWESYSSDGTYITIPIENLFGLTAEAADTVTGDWRKIVQAFVRTMHNYQEYFQWTDRTRTVSDNELIQSYDYPIAKHDWQVVFRTDDSDPPDMVSDPN